MRILLLLLLVGCASVKPTTGTSERSFDLAEWLVHMGVSKVSISGDLNYRAVSVDYLRSLKVKLPKEDGENFDCDEVSVLVLEQVLRDHRGPLSAAAFRIKFKRESKVIGHEANIFFGDDDTFWYLDPRIGVLVSLRTLLSDFDIILSSVEVLR